MGSVAYRLALPEQSALHPVFHVLVLKAYHGPRPPELSSDSDLPQSLQPRPATILARRTTMGDRGSRTEVFVDWEGLPRGESTWEEWDKLVQLFPEVDLEGKVIVEGG